MIQISMISFPLFRKFSVDFHAKRKSFAAIFNLNFTLRRLVLVTVMMAKKRNENSAIIGISSIHVRATTIQQMK